VCVCVCVCVVKKVLSAVQKCIAHDIATTVSRLQPVNRLRESVVRDVMFR